LKKVVRANKVLTIEGTTEPLQKRLDLWGREGVQTASLKRQ